MFSPFVVYDSQIAWITYWMFSKKKKKKSKKTGITGITVAKGKKKTLKSTHSIAKKKKSKKTGITVARGKKKKLKSTHSIAKHGKIMWGGAVFYIAP